MSDLFPNLRKPSTMILCFSNFFANSIAKEVGIKKFVSDVSPDDKEKEVRKLQDDGKKVAFVHSHFFYAHSFCFCNTQ